MNSYILVSKADSNDLAVEINYQISQKGFSLYGPMMIEVTRYLFGLWEEHRYHQALVKVQKESS